MAGKLGSGVLLDPMEENSDRDRWSCTFEVCSGGGRVQYRSGKLQPGGIAQMARQLLGRLGQGAMPSFVGLFAVEVPGRPSGA